MSITYTQSDLTNEATWKTLRLAKHAELTAEGHAPLTMTTELTIDWDKTHRQDNTEISAQDANTYARERDIKSREMWLNDKTNPNVVFVESATKIHRYFVNAEAAQEWADFIAAQATSHSLKTPECQVLGRIRFINMAQALQERDARAISDTTTDASGGEL